MILTTLWLSNFFHHMTKVLNISHSIADTHFVVYFIQDIPWHRMAILSLSFLAHWLLNDRFHYFVVMLEQV